MSASACSVLLHAGTSENRRLAARLVPRFLHLFPHLVDVSGAALLALHRGDAGNAQATTQGKGEREDMPGTCSEYLISTRT